MPPLKESFLRKVRRGEEALKWPDRGVVFCAKGSHVFVKGCMLCNTGRNRDNKASCCRIETRASNTSPPNYRVQQQNEP
eukprot:1108909-Prorocentrum_minimum.AAC.1